MAWQGNGMGAAWARHAMCESAFKQTKIKRPPFKCLVKHLPVVNTGEVYRYFFYTSLQIKSTFVIAVVVVQNLYCF